MLFFLKGSNKCLEPIQIPQFSQTFHHCSLSYKDNPPSPPPFFSGLRGLALTWFVERALIDAALSQWGVERTPGCPSHPRAHCQLTESATTPSVDSAAVPSQWESVGRRVSFNVISSFSVTEFYLLLTLFKCPVFKVRSGEKLSLTRVCCKSVVEVYRFFRESFASWLLFFFSSLSSLSTFPLFSASSQVDWIKCFVCLTVFLFVLVLLLTSKSMKNRRRRKKTWPKRQKFLLLHAVCVHVLFCFVCFI